MNLLAHAYLSPPIPGILAGNLAADWIKGKARLALPPDLLAGVQLHRRIDIFTDTQPVVDRCIALISPTWGRYSPILVDMFFDHILAATWPRHSSTGLPVFAAQTYATLNHFKPLLPESCHFPIAALIADDWFCAYATLDGLRLSLTRMSTRLRSRRHDIELAPAAADLFHLLPAFQSAFDCFFPELQAHLGFSPAVV